jgi:glutamate N-acetyltransferase/amino-acid N-acetyltransferase
MSDEKTNGPFGFKAAGVTCGIKPSGASDLGMIFSDRPAVTAAVTTQNLFRGPPVILTCERLAENARVRGVIVNSGVSNACTGKPGLNAARKMTALAESATGCTEGDFLVSSTGVIGDLPPLKKIAAAVPGLVSRLSPGGWTQFASSVMTTDTHPKISRQAFKVGRGAHAPMVTVLGIAKGSGMIHPNMATMLAWIVTDYPLTSSRARKILAETTGRTFNCLSVDGDTSTSDMVLLMANGAAVSRKDITPTSDRRFRETVMDVATDLSRQLAADGEGATHLITIDVTGANSDKQAHQVAQSVARSCLVKTAMFGRDPNWGRICCAAGYAGVDFNPDRFQLKIQGTLIMRNGLPVGFNRGQLSRALKRREILVEIRLGSGRGGARVFTCDLSYDYIRINAEYTT